MKLLSYLLVLLGLSLSCRAVPAQSKHELAEEEELILVGREEALLKNKISRQMDEMGDSSGTCGAPPEISNGSVDLSVNPVASVATYNCNTGYMLDGSSVITCDTLEWAVDSIPTCNIINCGEPPEPVHGQVKYVKTTYESEAKYSCKPGFHLVGSASLVCKDDGKWNGTVKCELGSCSAPPTVYGGTFEASAVTVGSNVTYKCDEGHVMHGKAVIQCTESMEWSAAPSCKIIDCGAPPPIEDGKVIAPTTIYNSQATYQCNPGCIKIGAADILVCQLDGSWSGTPPSCLNPVEWTGDKFDKWYPQLVDVDFHNVEVNELVFAIHNLSYEIMKFQEMDDYIGCIDFMHMLLAIPKSLKDIKSKELAKDLHQTLGTFILRNPVSRNDARALKLMMPIIMEKLYEPVEKAVEAVRKITDETVVGISIAHIVNKMEFYFADILEAGKPIKAKEIVLYLVKIVMEAQNLIEVHLKQNFIMLNCEDIIKDLGTPVLYIRNGVKAALEEKKISAIIRSVTLDEPALCVMNIDPFISEFLHSWSIAHYTGTFEHMLMMYNLVNSANTNTLVNHWNVLYYLLEHPLAAVQKAFRSISKVVPLQATIESSGVRFSTSLHEIPEEIILELSTAIYPGWRYHNGKPESTCERIRDSISVFLGLFELKRFNYTLDGMFADFAKDFFSDIMKKHPSLDSRLKDKVQCKVDKILSEVYIAKMSTLVTRIKDDIDTRPYEKLSYNMATLVSEHRPKDLVNLLFDISQTLDIYSENQNAACNVSEDLISKLIAIVSGWEEISSAVLSQIYEDKAAEVLDACIDSEMGEICIAADEELKRSMASSLGQLMSKTVSHLKSAIEQQLMMEDLGSLEMFISKEIALSIRHEVRKMEDAISNVPIL